MRQARVLVERLSEKEIPVKRVMVFGDAMLDHYYYGEVERISPEAPVPVLLVEKETYVPGGAANVAVNLARLGVQVFFVSTAGNDPEGNILKKQIAEDGINVDAMLEMPVRTTVKTRVISSQQQMLRLDYEYVHELDSDTCERLLELIKAKMVEFNVEALVISDYAKGLCTRHMVQSIIKYGQQLHIPILIGPKGSDWSKYIGADYIIPNVRELGDAFGMRIRNEESEIEAYGYKARQNYQCKYLLVTRSEKGMSLIEENDIMHIHSDARDVYDVTGAGDTVLAVLAMSVLYGLTPGDSVRLANLAAAQVVGKLGTYPINRQELQNALQDTYRTVSDPADKITDKGKLFEIISQWKLAGDRIVLTNGCFDIIHGGHVNFLHRSAKLGDRLVVAINSDESVRRLKGKNRPFNREMDRACLLASFAWVDAVVLFSEDTPEGLLREIMPDILTKGADYRPEDVVGREYADELVILPLFSDYSTTNALGCLAREAAKKDD